MLNCLNPREWVLSPYGCKSTDSFPRPHLGSPGGCMATAHSQPVKAMYTWKGRHLAKSERPPTHIRCQYPHKALCCFHFSGHALLCFSRTFCILRHSSASFLAIPRPFHSVPGPSSPSYLCRISHHLSLPVFAQFCRRLVLVI
jgi:hypothetical protein